jgi:hypothetical protein
MMRVCGNAVLAQIVQTAVIGFAVKMVGVVELWTMGYRTLLLKRMLYTRMCCIDQFVLFNGVQCTEMQLWIVDDNTLLLTVLYL